MPRLQEFLATYLQDNLPEENLQSNEDKILKFHFSGVLQLSFFFYGTRDWKI